MTRKKLDEMLTDASLSLMGEGESLGEFVYDFIDFHWGISGKLAKRGLDCRDDDRLVNDFLNAAAEEITEYERLTALKI